MFTLPGEYIGTPEEYDTGFGTYKNIEKGEIRSSNIGKLKLNKEKHKAEVKTDTKIPKMQSPGTIILGKVTKTRDQVIEIEPAPFESKKFKFVPNEKPAILHISNIKDDYIDNIKTQYKIGDIVRAKITGMDETTVELATDQGNLGTVKAYCSKCRQPMEKIGKDKVKCKECGNVTTRKTAKDYGEGNVK